jgi:hypothetical protein
MLRFQSDLTKPVFRSIIEGRKVDIGFENGVHDIIALYYGHLYLV